MRLSQEIVFWDNQVKFSGVVLEKNKMVVFGTLESEIFVS